MMLFSKKIVLLITILHTYLIEIRSLDETKEEYKASFNGTYKYQFIS